MKGYIATIDIKNEYNNLLSMIIQLINESSDTYLLNDKIDQKIDSIEQIQSLIRNWPSWPSSEWVVGGKIKKGCREEFVYGNSSGKKFNSNFNEKVNQLMNTFDWAVFSYFTTYHTDFVCLVSCDASIMDANTFRHFSKEDIEINWYKDEPISCLKTASFYDYDEEGYYVYELSQQNGEEPPLLLCSFDLTDPEYNLKWDEERDDVEEVPWYKEHLEKLFLVDEFVTEHYRQKNKKQIYRVDNLQAYLDIWAEASEEHSIAEATLAANADLKVLKSQLCEFYSFDITKECDA